MGNSAKKHYNKSDPNTKRNDGALMLFLRGCLGNFCAYINKIYYACLRQEQEIAFKSFLNQKSTIELRESMGNIVKNNFKFP